MTSRQTATAVRRGELKLLPDGKVEAISEFQRKRLTEAVTTARVYLGGKDTAQIARSLGVTQARAGQIVQLGIAYMRSAGWLIQAQSVPSSGGAG